MRNPDSGRRRPSYLHYWERHNPMPEDSHSAALVAHQVATANSLFRKGLERIARGSRITNPSDATSSTGVSIKLSAAAMLQGSLDHTIGNAVSLLQTQDGALKMSGKILERISELRKLTDDVTKSPSDKANYNSEFLGLKGQLDAITKEAFNGVPLFGSTPASINASEDAATKSPITVAARDLGCTSTGVGTITTANSLGDIRAVSLVTVAIENVASMRAGNGSEQASLGVASERLTINQANLEAASSRILDVHVARESTHLVTKKTLAATGSSLLMYANQSSLATLRLLQ